MEVQKEALNITDSFSMKYPIANMIFPNKTVILLTSKAARGTITSSQQMALLAGMAFIGGIIAGLLFRFLYFGIVKYFMKNMDQLAPPQRPVQGNINVTYVDDNFRLPNDGPPDYVTVLTETSPNSPAVQSNRIISKTVPKISEEAPPPTYISIVSSFGRVLRSAST